MKVRKAVIQEAIDSGVEEIMIITGKSKKAIEDHFDKNVELELELEKKPMMNSLKWLETSPATT